MLTTTTKQSAVVTAALTTGRIAGPIVQLRGSSFQIQGGPGVGYTWITPSATTKLLYQQLVPALNEYAIITYTGSVTAPVPVLIGLFPSNPLTANISGTIATEQPYGISVHLDNSPVYLALGLSAKSNVTGGLAIGTHVTASGLGSGAVATAFFPDSITTNGSTPAPTATPAATPPPPPPAGGTWGTYTTTSFMPGTAGKISAFQIFDETGNGTISSGAAAADGGRYSAVWGARVGLGATWRTNNAALKSGYYLLMDTDLSTGAWGAIGHTLAWWQTNHPDWIMYACTAAGTPTKTPAYDSGLPNVPLDIHNPAVVQYQIAQMAGPFAARNGYTAIAADEVTFWFPGSGGPGYYPCGIYQNGTFVRRYTSATDVSWETDVVNWVKAAHTAANNLGLKLIVSHPGGNITANEAALLANTDADMDETGFIDYGRPLMPSVAPVTREANWMKYAQAHGTAVLINQDWGTLPVDAYAKDYSIATYLLGAEQAASLFTSSHTGYGVENWLPEYNTPVGTPCGEYYGGATYSAAAPAMYYRKFANAFVVVNAGGSGTEKAPLPAGHTYTDLEGRAVSNPLTVAPNDGYVLKTTNGCT